MFDSYYHHQRKRLLYKYKNLLPTSMEELFHSKYAFGQLPYLSS